VVFSTSLNGATVTSVTIPAGSSSTSFYYGDTKAASPTITAISSPLTSASQTETVTAAAPTKLAFAQQPTNTTAGATISPAVTVQILDAYGNLTSSTASVSLTGPATLSGTTTVNAVNGVASFSTLSVTKAGTGYSLSASSPTLTGATSGSFNVTAANISLSFSPCPASTKKGWTFSYSVVRSTADQFGNPDPNAGSSLTVNLTGTNGSWASPQSVTIAAGSTLSSTTDAWTNTPAMGVSVTLTGVAAMNGYSVASCTYLTTH
jgi:hypothetical protein